MPNQSPVVRGPVCTFGFRRRRSDGVDPVVWWDGAVRPTVAPLALTSYVVASLVHLGGAPRLKCSMTLLLSNSLTKILLFYFIASCPLTLCSVRWAETQVQRVYTTPLNLNGKMQGLCAEAPLKYIYIIYFYIMIYIIDNSIYQGRYHVQGEYIIHKEFDKTRLHTCLWCRWFQQMDL